MTTSTAPPELVNSDLRIATKPPIRVGCRVMTARGDVGRVIEIRYRDFRVHMASGVIKSFLIAHRDKFKIVDDVPRSGREGRFLERLSKPRPVECESCGKPLTDLASIAIGKGPGCRSKAVRAQKKRLDERRSSLVDKIAAGEEGAVAELMGAEDDEEAARFIIWIYGLDP